MSTYDPVLTASQGGEVILYPDWFVITDAASKNVPELLDGVRLQAPEKVKVFIDHQTPCGTEAHANIQRRMIRFATEQGCELYNGYGIAYQLMLDQHVKAGDVIAHCGDFGSIYGAAGACAVKLSPEELAEAIKTGEVRVKAPEKLRLQLTGKLNAPACAKDAALVALRLLGDTKGKLLLVSGELPEGAERTAFFQMLSAGGCEAALAAETDGQPDVTVDLDAVVPSVTGPSDLFKAVPAAERSDVKITAVFIGGCSAGRIEDMRAAAAVIRGRRVQRKVRVTIAFATTEVYVQAANEGLIDQFMDAGALVMNQGCSGCYAVSQAVVDDKDVVLSAGSRICPSSVGGGYATTYLCSAATAMESAIQGYICPATV